MMKHLHLFTLHIFTLLLITSCNKAKLKAPEASFMVAYPSVKVTSVTQGSNSDKITDLWLYVDDQFQGCFAAGAVMPIVASGSAKISFLGGIKNNGIADTRQPYFFYRSFTINQDIEAGKTYTVNPVFEYISTAQYKFTDDFDGVGSHFQPLGDSAYTATTNNAYGGTGKSIFMSMSDAKPTAKMITTTYYSVPLGGAAVYLEMNYKCNQPIEVGIVSGTQERPTLIINPSLNWNKIYIDLRTVLNTQPTSNACKFYISATKQTTTPEIYIDNVKVVSE